MWKNILANKPPEGLRNLISSSEPRPLTPDQISSLVDNLPAPFNTDPEVISARRDSLISWMTEELRNKELSPDGLVLLQEEMNKIELRSRILPGAPVGRTIAETAGAGITQEQLDVFKMAGAKRSAPVTEILKSILENSPNIPNSSMTIYFENRYTTYADVVAMKSIFEATTLGDILHSSNEYNTAILERGIRDPWWYKTHELIYGKLLPASLHILRFYVSVKKMYLQGITPKMIRDMIQFQRPRSVVCVYSPLSEASKDNDWSCTIDVFPDSPDTAKNEILNRSNIAISGNPNTSLQVGERMFLENAARQLVNEVIKGIPDIFAISPKSYPTTDFIKTMTVEKNRENSIEQLEDGYSEWSIYLDKIMMKRTGVDLNRMLYLFGQNLIQDEGLRVVATINDPEVAIIVHCPDAEPGKEYIEGKTKIQTPTMVIDRVSKKVKSDIKEKQKLENSEISLDQSDLLQSIEYVYADTDGSNLQEVLAVDGVDRYLTITNVSSQILDLLGIEAARKNIDNFIYDTLKVTTSRSRQSSLSHMADVMTSTGVITGLNGPGVEARGGGVFTIGNVHKAFSVYQHHSFYEKTEKIEASTVAVMVGATPIIGSSLFKVRIDDPRVLEYEKSLKDKVIDISDMNSVMNKFETYHGMQVAKYLGTGEKNIGVGRRGVGAGMGTMETRERNVGGELEVVTEQETPILLIPGLDVSDSLKRIPELYNIQGVKYKKGVFIPTYLSETKIPLSVNEFSLKLATGKFLGLPEMLRGKLSGVGGKVEGKEVKLMRATENVYGTVIKRFGGEEFTAGDEVGQLEEVKLEDVEKIVNSRLMSNKNLDAREVKRRFREDSKKVTRMSEIIL